LGEGHVSLGGALPNGSGELVGISLLMDQDYIADQSSTHFSLLARCSKRERGSAQSLWTMNLHP
jgi:hypothetical protein